MNVLIRLRALMTDKGVDAYWVPQTDEFQSEYVAPYAARLQWLTEFTGSAGSAVVMADRAAFFTDGRYTLQAQDQVDAHSFEIWNSGEKRPVMWLLENLSEGMTLGFDPWLMTPRQYENFSKTLFPRGITLTPVENLIDVLWDDQPSRPKSFARPHEIEFSGEASSEKRQKIATNMKGRGVDRLLVTTLDAVAWLFNIRGMDLPHTPVVQAYALMNQEGHADLFIDLEKMQGTTFVHLGPEVRVISRNMLNHHLGALPKDTCVQADPDTVPFALIHELEAGGGKIVFAPDPCTLPKAVKNVVELAGMRRAHLRDGLALTKFMAWLMTAFNTAPLTEILVSDKLEAFRKEGLFFMGLSFDTISAMGPHGAIVHYKATKKSDIRLEKGIYLLDSGAQYLDGTTDVTRTFVLGEATLEQKENFTRVLKGHIGIATATFPQGTTGGQLDVLARRSLWEVGLDYDHGTGHGVGSFLNVHEGPQSISKVSRAVPLVPGMILSNEPGYYKAGEYGIRIESLVIVREEPSLSLHQPFYGFETITCAPIDRNLIISDLLTAEEKAWLNGYHVWVYENLSGGMTPEEASWLKVATAPLL